MRTHVASTAPNGILGAVPAAAASASELMHRASDVVRQEAHALSEQTGRYIRDEPMKSLVIAAGIGAAVAGLIALLAMSRTR
jgi:ElaB/YqjD/DUF883 family membrane-anchored ribosome-binding protein